jgi:mono/diheme cytochrome c family protein
MHQRSEDMKIVPTLLGAAVVSLIALINVTAVPVPIHAAPSRLHSAGEDGDPINGRKVYLRENCYICHGGRVGGGMCPSFRDDPRDEGDVEDAVLGGTSSGMPSYRGRITQREIADIAAYFATLRSVREPTFTHWWEPGTPTR